VAAQLVPGGGIQSLRGRARLVGLRPRR
jgi:hypothetical protein